MALLDAPVPSGRIKAMNSKGYEVVLRRNRPSGWVAEIPSVPGCQVLMPTRKAALAELNAIISKMVEEHARKNGMLANTAQINRAGLV